MADITRPNEKHDQVGQLPNSDNLDDVRNAPSAGRPGADKGPSSIVTGSGGRQYLDLSFVQASGGKAVAQHPAAGEQLPADAALADEQQQQGQDREEKPPTPTAKSMATDLTTPVPDALPNAGGVQDIGGLNDLGRDVLMLSYLRGGQKAEDKLVADINAEIAQLGSKATFSIKTLEHEPGHPEKGVTKIYKLADGKGHNKDLFLENFGDETKKANRGDRGDEPIRSEELIADFLSGNKNVDPAKLEAIKANLRGDYRDHATHAMQGELHLGELYEKRFVRDINEQLQKKHPELELTCEKSGDPNSAVYSYFLKNKNTGDKTELISNHDLDPEHRDKDAQRIAKYALHFSKGVASPERKEQFSKCIEDAYRYYQTEGVAEVTKKMNRALQGSGFEVKGGLSEKRPITANYWLESAKNPNKRTPLIENLNLSELTDPA